MVPLAGERRRSEVRVHRLPRDLHLGDQDATAFRFGDVQMTILWAAIGDVSGVGLLA